MLLSSFLSGAAALTYQVLWQRCLAQEIGVDTTSSTIIVTIFLFGLGLGYLAGSRVSDALGEWSLAAFAVVEGLIGICGVWSIEMIRGANALISSWIVSYPSDFAVNLVLLTVPTFLMGMSTPLLMATLRIGFANIGRSLGWYYGANILGASVGALLCGLVLVETFGLNGTQRVAALLNAGAAAIALVTLWHRLRVGAFVPRQPLMTATAQIWQRGGSRWSLHWRLQIACMVFGFATLSFEMIAIRALSYQFSLNAYVFPVLLSSFLLVTALGEFTVGWASDRVYPRIGNAIFPLLLVFVCASLLLSFWLPPEPERPQLDLNGFVRMAWYSLVFVLPVFWLSGFYPLLVKTAIVPTASASSIIGFTLFLTTVANGLGSIVTSFVLFEHLGTVSSVWFIVVLCGFGVLLVSSDRISLVLVAAAIGLLVLLPRNYYTRSPDFYLHQQPEEVTETHQGVFTTLRDGTSLAIRMFRTPTSEVIPQVDYQRLHKWNFAAPILLSENFRPKRALIIGLGNALPVYGLSRFGFVESVDVVELVDPVVDYFRRSSAPELVQMEDSGRVRIHLGDGRRFAKEVRGRKTYDLVQIGVLHPWMSGASNVYTTEFFEDVRKILSPGGMVAVHDHYPLVDNTALEVFKYAYSFSTDRFHYFTDVPITFRGGTPLTVPRKLCEEAQWTRRGVSLASGSLAKTAIVNTDDLPVMEYFLLRNLRNGTSGDEPKDAGAVDWKPIATKLVTCER